MSDIEELQERLRQFAAERDWEQYHTPKNLAMALAGEAGELLAEFQWLTPSEAAGVMDVPARADAVRDELADVMIYLARLADVLGVDLSEVAHAKVTRNGGRFPVPSADDERQIVVEGSPSAAEGGAHEQRWRRAVAEAATGRSPCERVTIAITLEPQRRRIDIDNLARVVLAGLRDAGVCSHGFRGLDQLLATKGVGEPGAVVILDPTIGPPPSDPTLSVTADAVPGSRDLDMATWEAAVAAVAVTSHVTGPRLGRRRRPDRALARRRDEARHRRAHAAPRP